MAEKMDKGIEYWKDAWDQNDIGFHQFKVHSMLQKHSSLLFQEGESKKILIPLCGKTLDMKWLSDQGQTVVGVDAVKKSLESFYTENGLKWTEDDAPKMGPECRVLEPEDGSLKLYFGDIFLLNKSVEGEFDCIWDRGSLVALDRKDVKKYAGILKEVLKPGGKILTEVFNYDLSIFEGLGRPPPPHAVFESEMRSLFEPDCSVQEVDRASRLLKEKEVELVYYLIVKK